MTRHNVRAARLGRNIDWPVMSFYSSTRERRQLGYQIRHQRVMRDLTTAAQQMAAAFNALPQRLQELALARAHARYGQEGPPHDPA